jgi:hypothetical protein
MKEGNLLEGEFPNQVTPILDRYLGVERRELLGMAGHASVWVNVRGESLCARAVDRAVRARTRQLLGHEMGTHAFRHCLTTAVLTSPQGRRWTCPWCSATARRSRWSTTTGRPPSSWRLVMASRSSCGPGDCLPWRRKPPHGPAPRARKPGITLRREASIDCHTGSTPAPRQ